MPAHEESSQPRSGQSAAPGHVRAARWHWDLASGRMEWDEGLKAAFGYTERSTEAEWRSERIHPEDRERVGLSLERAAIVNHGAVWSEKYRFRQADGRYVAVVERARVVSDVAGPHWVLGAVTPAPAARPGRR